MKTLKSIQAIAAHRERMEARRIEQHKRDERVRPITDFLNITARDGKRFVSLGTSRYTPAGQYRNIQPHNR